MPKRNQRPSSPAPSNKDQHHHDCSPPAKKHDAREPKKMRLVNNPFAITGHHDNDGQNETEQQRQQQQAQAAQLLEHVLVFSDAQKRGRGGGAGGSDSANEHVKLVESIQFLTDFIEQSSSTTTFAAATASRHETSTTTTSTATSILSASDISQLLLPWAVQRVLSVRAAAAAPSTTIAVRKAATMAATKEEEEKGNKAREEDLMTLVWKALRVTLLSLLGCDSRNSSNKNVNPRVKNGTTSSLPGAALVLSQSDLFKLVPRIAQMAIISSTSRSTHSSSLSFQDDDDNNASAAGAVYKLLLATRLFTPTMDVACRTVFCPLVSNLALDRQPLFSILLATRRTTREMDEITTRRENSTSTAPAAMNVNEDCSILTSTLEWMQSILKSGRGNPKTTFQLVSTPTVLRAFSRAYFYLHLHDVHDQKQQRQSHPSSSIMWMSEIPLLEESNVQEENSSSTKPRKPSELVRTILYDALFHAASHMDGFRSLLLSKKKKKKVKDTAKAAEDAAAAKPSPIKSSFSCYQQDLLDFINDTLTAKDDHQKDRIQQNTDAAAAATNASQKEGAFIIPILYRGFLLESAKWHQQTRASTGGGGGGSSGGGSGGGKRPLNQDVAAPLTRMQFAMFVEMATPLRDLAFQADNDSDSALNLVALRALREMANLLLVHDAYIPAEDDAQRSQTAFLDEIVTQLLDRAARGDGDVGVEWLSECIHLLRTLVQLNHLLLHERLVQVMTIAFQSNNTRLRPHIADFFAIFVDTYRKLRQQAHFFQSVLVALTQFEQEEKHVQISVLGRLLNDSQTLASSIALLVQDIPITQVREIFEAIEHWIVERSQQNDDHPRQTSEALDVVVQLTIITARNVRVDSSRVKEVAAVVKKFVETAVTLLMDQDQAESTSRLGSVRAALSLCGWFIHLQSRCAFWLGRGAQLLIPTKVQDYMTRTVTESTVDRDLCLTDSVYDDVLFLVSHRLAQLSSLIHDEQVAELLRGSPSTMVSDFVSEARQLAVFMAKVAKCPKAVSRTSSRPRWVVIAVTVHSWGPFAEEEHIDWFLDWLFSVLSLDPASPSLPPDSLAYREDLRGIDEEVEVANGLMLDASFHEISQIASRLRTAALCCSSKWISWALADHKSMKKTRSVMANSRQDSRAKSDLIVDLEIPHFRLESVDVDVMTRRLSRALRPVLLANGLSQHLCKGEAQALSRATLALDQVCVAISKLGSAILNVTVALTSALRALLARCLDDLPNEEFDIMRTTDPHWIKVCKHLVLSSDRVCPHDDCDSLVQQARQQHILFVTGKLVSNIASRSISSSDALADLMRTLQPFFKNCDMGNNSNSSAMARVALIRYILLGLEMGQVKTKNCHYATVEAAWSLGWKTYSSFNEQLEDDRHGRGHCFRLAGDLLRLAFNWQVSHDHNGIAVGQMSQVVTRRLASHVTSSSSRKDGHGHDNNNITEEQRPHDEALYYAIACIVHTKPSVEVSLPVLTEIIQVDQPHDLLDASFCRLVSELDGQHLEVILRRLLLLRDDERNDGKEENYNKSSVSLSSRLRFLDFIVLHGKKDSHVECISQFGVHAFLLALQALYKRHPGQDTSSSNSTDCCRWTEGIIQGTKLLTDLIKRRDLISLRERDLALVLAHLSAVLGPGGGGKDATSTTVYLACIRLFSFVQQRFPKQLHTCAPSVISLMHSFLRHAMVVNVVDVMKIPSQQQQRLMEQDISIRAQEFSRICELLISHREVYKKHIVSLVLAFVQCASATATTATKGDKSNIHTATAMPLTVREALVPAIHYLLDAFSVYETKTLNAQMDLQCKTTFRSIYQSYQKVHTYKGQ